VFLCPKISAFVNICQSYGQKYRGPFLTHSVEAFNVHLCLFSLKLSVTNIFVSCIVMWPP